MNPLNLYQSRVASIVIFALLQSQIFSATFLLDASFVTRNRGGILTSRFAEQDAAISDSATTTVTEWFHSFIQRTHGFPRG